jgi:mRNA interferase MazF
MRRGEIRWYRFKAPDKRRPVLLLTRDTVIDALNEIIVVPVTRTIRGLGTEVLLTEADGLPTMCALNFDHVGLAQRSRLEAVITTLPSERWKEVEQALLLACGFTPKDEKPESSPVG